MEGEVTTHPTEFSSILSKLETYQAKPVIPEKPKKKSIKRIIFNSGFAIATALSAQFMSGMPVQASSGLDNYDTRSVEIVLQQKDEEAGVLTSEEYTEHLPANYYEEFYSDLESQAMGTILPEELIYNLPGDRSVEAWQSLVDHLNVTENPRYEARYANNRFNTYCNVYLRDVLREFGVAIPVTYTEPSTGQIKPTLANNMFDRFSMGSFSQDNPVGGDKEWEIIDVELAQQLADEGYPVVVAVKNLAGGSGHVALLAPEEIVKGKELEWNSQNDGEETKGDLVVMQAGEKNGLLRWNDGHYSPDNRYSERKIFVSREDLIYFQNQRKLKLDSTIDESSQASAQELVTDKKESSHKPPIEKIVPQISPKDK